MSNEQSTSIVSPMLSCSPTPIPCDHVHIHFLLSPITLPITHRLLSYLILADTHRGDMTTPRAHRYFSNLHPSERNVVIERMLYYHVERLLSTGCTPTSRVENMRVVSMIRHASTSSTGTTFVGRQQRALAQHQTVCEFVMTLDRWLEVVTSCVRKVRHHPLHLFAPIVAHNLLLV